MYCPMRLDCQMMTGVIYNCPNLSECLTNSPLERETALGLYWQNLGINSQEIPPFFPASLPIDSGNEFVYNLASERRDIIIFGFCLDWDNAPGGRVAFDSLSINQLEQLFEHGYVDPNDRQNYAPTHHAFLEFARWQAQKGLEFSFTGYAISPFRRDYRVTLDGLYFRGQVPSFLIQEFVCFAHNADELKVDPYSLRAWWD
ncbi:hypothetical protein [Spirulina subsalsa]|uniref:hypothetical protein n=1 Tax=Spirulina subsalsa TaxID=54311 RepID=UPI000319E6F5|nr:hypothetical protein [Spirulina subsalsa]